VGDRTDTLSQRDSAFDLDRPSRLREPSAAETLATDPAVLTEDIEQTRAEMGETIDAIQDRLDPERLTNQAVDAATEVTVQARDAAKDVAKYAIDEAKLAVRELADQATTAVRRSTIEKVEHMAMNTRDSAQTTGNDVLSLIQHNPIPAALAGIGLGWLWMKRSSAASADYGRVRYGYGYASDNAGYSAGGPMTGMTDTAQQIASDAQQKATQVVDQTQQMASSIAGRAENTAGQMQDTTMSIAEGISANPIALGALGLALGAAAALILPETEQEDQLLGEARDRVMDRVQNAAGETAEKVQRVAAEARQSALREAKAEGLAPAAGSASSGA
jgi:hypothetical protein